ncbi:MATE family efflux transporter (plasmid) [Priestia megaterium]|nr:MATE family efflux transporter [Priestia megaterium]
MKYKVIIVSLLSLALPAIIEQVLQSMVGFVDTFFISKLGLREVAAVGITNAILQIYFAVFLSISTAATVYISRFVGQGDNERAKKIVTQSIFLSVLVGVIFGLISLLFSSDLLALMGAKQDVIHVGEGYFKIVTVPSLIISLMFTCGALLRGIGDTKTPMKIGIRMNIIHIVLDYVLIFGVFFGGFGIVGAALATVIARVSGVSMYIYYLYKKRLLVPFSQWKIEGEWLKKLFNLGLPTAFERLFMRVGQILYFGMIIRMGTDIYAAHTLTGNFTIFSSVIGTGLAVATTTLIGKHLGSNELEEVKKYGRISVITTSVVMTGVLLLVWIISPYFATLFTSDTKVITLITTVLLIDVIAQPATGIVTSLTAILQAGGDTKFPMYVTAVGIWGIRTLGVYLLGVHFQFGLVGAWAAIAIDNYFRAFILYMRYRSYKWIKKIT